MKIIYHKNLDFEPLSMSLHTRGIVATLAVEVKQVVIDWLKDRDAHHRCPGGCHQKYCAVQPSEKQKTIQLDIQWACRRCLQQLFAILEQRCPFIKRVDVGYDDLPSLSVDRNKILNIPERFVTFEDGHQEIVQPFAIRQYPVSVAEFDAFCRTTGYCTSAERQRRYDTFRDNPLATSPHDDATMLSFNDAAAFCLHYRFRLPSEAEFLAAAVVDDNVHNFSESQIARLARSADIIRAFGNLITGTRVDDNVVLRYGPCVVKTPDWADDRNRKLVSPDDVCGVFCVCVDGSNT